MQQTKPIKEIYKIPLRSYQDYIKENVNRNAELEWAKNKDTPLPLKERLNYYKSLGERFLSSKVKYLL